ncbi:hypothetical protein ACFV05_12250, partial [Streptomyces pseudogriseolus]
MNRTTLSLIAGVTALAAVTGFAAVSAPDPGAAEERTGAAATLPVERTGLLCPQPSTSDLAETTYTSFTPVTEGADDKGTAVLRSAAQQSAPEEDADGGSEDEKDGENGSTGEDGENDKKDEQGGKDAAKDDKADKPVLQLQAPGKPVAVEANGADAPALVGTADGRVGGRGSAPQTTGGAAGPGPRGQGGARAAAATPVGVPRGRP